MRIVRTRRGARVLEGDLVLSEVVDAPGPTHSLFDVLAAAVGTLAPGPRVAVLGFAAGGVVAPLRALGFGHPLAAVDLDLTGERLFRELSHPWAGRVDVDEADAVAWLGRRRRRWDLILEDLSAPGDAETTKPGASLDVLPGLMARRLAPGGVAVTNVLPVPGLAWRDLLDRLARPWPEARVLLLDDWENRVLVGARALPTARALTAELRRVLSLLGSEEAGGVRTTTWKTGGVARRARR